MGTDHTPNATDEGDCVPMKNKFYKPTHNVILAFKLNVIYLNVGIFWKILA
jgi:hypothetical protein